LIKDTIFGDRKPNLLGRKFEIRREDGFSAF
jgi:hypothetical protein